MGSHRLLAWTRDKPNSNSNTSIPTQKATPQKEREQHAPVVVHGRAAVPYALRRREAQEMLPAGRPSGGEAGGALFRQPRRVGNLPQGLGCCVWRGGWGCEAGQVEWEEDMERDVRGGGGGI